MAARKYDVKTRRRAVAAAAAPPQVGQSLRALRETAAQLTADGRAEFSVEELLTATLRAHPALRRPTLRNNLEAEFVRPDATIAPADGAPAREDRPGSNESPQLRRPRSVAADRLLAHRDRSLGSVARPAGDGRLCGEVVLDTLHRLTDPSAAARHRTATDTPAGVSVEELLMRLLDDGHFYEPSGVYRAVRRAREAGLVVVVQERPLRVRPVGHGAGE
ncbi:MAG: hypothetical protein Q7J48_01265 [Nocardioides sp.]|nr:hypothetical protein [Nocardioides sp.]